MQVLKKLGLLVMIIHEFSGCARIHFSIVCIDLKSYLPSLDDHCICDGTFYDSLKYFV